MTRMLRNELPGDIESIQRVIEKAFLTAQYSDQTEHLIVNALRTAGALTVSQVAVEDGAIVGHIALSPVRVSDGTTAWYGLGPIAVSPEMQGRGVGSALMRSALSELKALGAKGCVVLGDPDFYQRFGFSAIRGLTLPGVPAEFFQALSFTGAFPQGEVHYHAAFSVQS